MSRINIRKPFVYDGQKRRSTSTLPPRPNEVLASTPLSELIANEAVSRGLDLTGRAENSKAIALNANLSIKRVPVLTNKTGDLLLADDLFLRPDGFLESLGTVKYADKRIAINHLTIPEVITDTNDLYRLSNIRGAAGYRLRNGRSNFFSGLTAGTFSDYFRAVSNGAVSEDYYLSDRSTCFLQVIGGENGTYSNPTVGVDYFLYLPQDGESYDSLEHQIASGNSKMLSIYSGLTYQKTWALQRAGTLAGRKGYMLELIIDSTDGGMLRLNYYGDGLFLANDTQNNVLLCADSDGKIRETNIQDQLAKLPEFATNEAALSALSSGDFYYNTTQQTITKVTN